MHKGEQMDFKQPKAVTITGTSRTYTFKSTDEVIAFAETEQSHWGKFSQCPGDVGPAVSGNANAQAQFFQSLKNHASGVQAAYAGNNSNPDSPPVKASESSLDSALGELSGGRRLSTDSPLAGEVLAVAGSDIRTAACIMYFLSPQARDQLSQAGGSGMWWRDALLAVFRAARADTTDAERSRIKTQYEEALSSVDAAEVKRSREEELRKDGFGRLCKSMEGALAKFSEGEREAIEQAQRQWAGKCEQVDAEWAGLKRLLDERVSFAAPRTYWEDRAKALSRASFKSGVAFFSVAAAGALAFFLYGLPTLSSVTQSPGASHLDLFLVVLPLLVPTFLAIWVLRITGRLMTNYLALSEDARERRTMVETFLALSREGADGSPLITPEDRRIILEALFRPSRGSTADDSPPLGTIDWARRTLGGQH